MDCNECKKLKVQKCVAWRMYYKTKEILIETILELKPTESIKNRIKNLIKMKPDYFQDKCCVCLEKLEGNITMLMCGCYSHHNECIKNLNNCPLCRAPKKIYTELDI